MHHAVYLDRLRKNISRVHRRYFRERSFSFYMFDCLTEHNTLAEAPCCINMLHAT